MPPKQKRNIWEKKRFFDMWSVPHFLFGILTAFLPLLFSFSVTDAFLITLVLALLWEVYEKFVQINETVWNSLIDIILPVISFFGTNKLLSILDIDSDQAMIIFIGVLFVYIFTNVSGWLAFRRRNRDFTH